MASRGIGASQLSKRPHWFAGPEFLWKADLSTDSPLVTIKENDPEVKTSFGNINEKNYAKFSYSYREIFWLVRGKESSSKTVRNTLGSCERELKGHLIQSMLWMLWTCVSAEVVILKAVQTTLRRTNLSLQRRILYTSWIQFLDNDCILRVGRRLDRSSLKTPDYPSEAGPYHTVDS